MVEWVWMPLKPITPLNEQRHDSGDFRLDFAHSMYNGHPKTA
ncbi:hypothetical protein [Coleofasciculus sp. E2-BRE-01]